MNKTAIEYADYTWNPVVGCERGCAYCYARRFAERGLGEYGLYEKGQRFQPRFFPERLLEPTERLKPAHIFVCSMGELFGPWVPAEWQERVLSAARQTPWHTFMFLTKYPENLPQFNPWPDNCWVGATATTSAEAERALSYLADVDAAIRYISFEPLHDEIVLDMEILDWGIIGQQTNPDLPPLSGWVYGLIDCLDRAKAKVFLKDNLHWFVKRQEWPKEER